MGVSQVLKGRLLFVTDPVRDRAAVCEGAGLPLFFCGRHMAGDTGEIRALAFHGGDRADQAFGVLMGRVCQDGPCWRRLHDLVFTLHDNDAVMNLVDDGKVMGNKDDCRPVFAVDLL